MDLKDISRPVAPNLTEFSKVYRQHLKSNVLLLDTVVRYMTKQPGKRVRPMLVFLSAAVCGDINERTYNGATMVELLHTAALIHDDVVDQAGERRGMASINAVWKNKVAVLVGDFLLARGLLVSLESDEFGFLRVTNEAVQRMSEGELLQIQKSRQLDIDEETYFRIISDKTASLLATSCQIGAMSASKKDEDQVIMRNYGEKVGCAFQIRDDLFDYLSKGILIGKPVGNDLKQKKLTLPLIHAFSKAPRSEAKAIMKIVKGKPDKDDVRTVVEFVTNFGGIAYAEQKAQELVNEAKALLDDYPDSEAKTAMKNFADFCIERSA